MLFICLLVSCLDLVPYISVSLIAKYADSWCQMEIEIIQYGHFI